MRSALFCLLVCGNLRKSAVKCILFVVVDGLEKENVPLYIGLSVVHCAKSQVKA